MVFSSHPLYLDPPNWQYQQQQQQHQQQVFLFEGGNEISNNATSQQQPPMPPPTGGASRTIRPGSMTDRARMAKIPLLETALKCPRCESTNTKFCYFNNYSLTQPRHFCKTCRRYWTRGGALRNVPVGGGCRRATKRSSKKRSKSPAVSGTATNSADQNGNNMMDGGGQMAFFPQGTNQMGYEFPDHYTGGGNYATAPTDPHITRLFQTGIMSLADSSTDQQWSKLAEETAATSTMTSLPQMHPSFPFMANLSQQQQQEYSSLPSGLLYQFDQRGGHLGSSLDSLRNSNAVSLQSMMDSTAVTQFADVKMEDGNKGLRRSVELQAQAAGSNNNIMTNGNNQLNWVGTGIGIGNAWSDLFGFPSNASSTGHNGL